MPLTRPRSSIAALLANALLAKVLLVPALLALAPAPAHAQCQPRWKPFDPSTSSIAGVDGAVNAIVAWDPDGPGPLGEHVVVGGLITVAGSVPVRNIAIFNPATGQWAALGAGVNANVRALAVLPTGQLVVGGSFTQAGNLDASRIATWNGVTWAPLGQGVSGTAAPVDVNALATLPDGRLVAGGTFTTAGGVPASNIAAWDGSQWTPLGPGLTGGRVNALLALPGGGLIAGGTFANAGATAVNGVARWDGAAWSGLGTGIPASQAVLALARLENGDIVAAGQFTSAGGVNAANVARWNGSAWQPMGTGLPNGQVSAVAFGPDHSLHAAGTFFAAGAPAIDSIARWDGAAWQPVTTTAITALRSMARRSSGNLIVGGDFTVSSPAFGLASRVAEWNGSEWSSMGIGFNGSIYGVTLLAGGDLLVYGDFDSFAGVSTPFKIARWNGSSWSAVGGAPQLGTLISHVLRIAEAPNGDLITIGGFSIPTADGRLAQIVARWDGTSWSSMGGDFITNGAFDIIIAPNGQPVLAADIINTEGPPFSSIAAWNGSNWFSIGNGLSHRTFDAHVAHNGDILAAGTFTMSGAASVRSVARWNGSDWSAVGGGIAGFVRDVIDTRNGDVIVGGANNLSTIGFPSVSLGNLARWNGVSWQRLGTGLGIGLNSQVEALLELPNGDIVVGGTFTLAAGPLLRIARWDGSAWHQLGDGFNDVVASLDLLPNGDIIATGSFTRSGESIMLSIARWTSNPDCYANCDCSTGSPTLTPADFVCFLNRFRMGDLYANCDNSQGTPALTPADFVCFLNKFRAGCP